MYFFYEITLFVFQNIYKKKISTSIINNIFFYRFISNLMKYFFIIILSLTTLCSCGSSKDNANNNKFFQGKNTYEGSYTDYNRNVVESYKLSLFNDGTMTMTHEGRGQYNYTYNFEGTWKEGWKSFGDVEYYWVRFDGLDQKERESTVLFADKYGNVYHPNGKDGFNAIRNGNIVFTFHRINN